MAKKLILFDDLVNECGFFNSSTTVNNSSGCDHPRCGEYAYMYQNETEENGDATRLSYYDVLTIIARQVYREKLHSRKGLKKALKQFHAILLDAACFNTWLKKVKLKRQGACFSFSCPVARVVSREQIEELCPDVSEMAQEREAYDREWMVYDEKKRPCPFSSVPDYIKGILFLKKSKKVCQKLSINDTYSI